MNCKRFISLLLLITGSLFNILPGQSIQLSNITPAHDSPLNKIFYDYKLVKIQYDQLNVAMSSRGNEHILHLVGPDLDWNLQMFEHDIHSADYILLLGTDHGVKTLHRKPANTSMIGYLKSARGGQAKLVVANNYIAGMVELGGSEFFIEPANGMDASLSPDYLVIYNTDNIIQNTQVYCGYYLYQNSLKHVEEQTREIQNENRAGCYTVEVAISNDYTVLQKRGSEAEVENWNTTILTLMGTNYDNEFASIIEFVQTASFVALSQSGDPWDGISDINTQLEQHQIWASSGGYGGASYDVATNWTTKWSTGTIGLAWIGVVCTSLRYNVCSDYGGSNNCLRQLEAHETGHNFSCIHDASGSPYIMAPAINCTSVWPAASIAAVNQHIKTRSCLDICSGGFPPVADFTGFPTEGCIPFSVQFYDMSNYEPTSWLWTCNGGTPSTSTLQNPSILYKTFGKYDVTLKVSNAYGTNTITFKQYITAKDVPVTKFSKVIIERDVYFTNSSQYAMSYSWDFGDGETSTEVNPSHQYADDGVYTVTLQATNECGMTESKVTFTIVTTPIALFMADTTKGCANFKVKFNNMSSKNVISWFWEFPGGTPATSTAFEPTVEYKYSGNFDVRLTATNSKFKGTAEKLKYIFSDSMPLPLFDTVINGNVVSFINKTMNAKTWLWDFGDGNTSVELNPVHTYNQGIYMAKLISANPCGNDTFIKQIVIGSGLTISFKTNQSKGCIPFVVQFTNTSFGANFYQWSFPGGMPSSSTDQNPLITYNIPGTYDVQLLGGNSNDTMVMLSPLIIEAETSSKADFTSLVGGSTVYYTNQSRYATSYLWDFGDGNTSSEGSPAHQYSAEGEFIVKLFTTNQCGNDSIIKTIAVYLIPKVDFGCDTTIVCGYGNIHFKSRASSDVNLWSWKFDGGIPDVSSDKDPTIYYKSKGIYSVKLTVHNTNGENELVKQSYIKVISTVLCPDFVFYKNEEPNEVWTSNLSLNQNGILNVYPNPFNNNLNINGKSQSDQVVIRIFDLFGKEICLEKLSVEHGAFFSQMNLGFLKAGTYLINLSSNQENFTKTIFLSH